MSNPVSASTSPLTAKPNSIMQALFARMQRAGISSAQRAADQLQSGLALLTHQVSRPKSGTWQRETSWILDGLQGNAMDGLDLQCTMGEKTSEEVTGHRSQLQQNTLQARQALFFTPSPLGAAQLFVQNVGPFVGTCRHIEGDLRRMIKTLTHGDQNTDQDAARERNRTREKDKETVAPKGI